jgi:hypothetical protein
MPVILFNKHQASSTLGPRAACMHARTSSVHTHAGDAIWQAQDPELYAVNSITFHPCGTFATAGGDGLFSLFSFLALSHFTLISSLSHTHFSLIYSLALSLFFLIYSLALSLATAGGDGHFSYAPKHALPKLPSPHLFSLSLSLFRARARSLPFSFSLSLCLSNCKKADKCRAIWHHSIHFFIKALLRLSEALFRLYQSSIKGLLRLFWGCIRALLRLYEGSMKALWRLYEGSMKALWIN